MNFDRIFNPTLQEQIEDLEFFIARMRVKYKEGNVFCKYRLHKTGECNFFVESHREDCRNRCLLYVPDSKLYEKILKIHTDKLEKLKRGASENE